MARLRDLVAGEEAELRELDGWYNQLLDAYEDRCKVCIRGAGGRAFFEVGGSLIYRLGLLTRLGLPAPSPPPSHVSVGLCWPSSSIRSWRSWRGTPGGRRRSGAGCAPRPASSTRRRSRRYRRGGGEENTHILSLTHTITGYFFRGKNGPRALTIHQFLSSRHSLGIARCCTTGAHAPPRLAHAAGAGGGAAGGAGAVGGGGGDAGLGVWWGR